MPGDLHTHTNFSDGSSDIELLPKLAARAGLTHLAVSDHDTTLSAEYAYKHPVVRGVHMIPAVELTGFDFVRGRRVHILCYWPKLTPALKEFCALMAARRNEATEKSMDELEALYPQFCREEAKAFAARSGVTYKTHLIRLLFEYGYTAFIKNCTASFSAQAAGACCTTRRTSLCRPCWRWRAARAAWWCWRTPVYTRVWSLPHSLPHRAPLTA